MSSDEKLYDELVLLMQRTIDINDPDKQYIGFLAKKCMEITRSHYDTYVKLPITQKQLADRCGVSRQTIVSWIKDPNKITLKHLATILSLSEHGQLTEEDSDE